VAELRTVYTADFWEKKFGVIDLREMRVVKKLPTEDKPDGITYAPPFHKAYVSNERAKAESVIDVREDKIMKVLRFDSETGVPQYDPIARKVYVNLQDENVLAVIDPATDTVVGRYPVEGCQGNHGMALDPEQHRAFLACQGNDVLTVFNLDSQSSGYVLVVSTRTPDVPRLAELKDGRVGVEHGSWPRYLLDKQGIPTASYLNQPEIIDAVARGEVLAGLVTDPYVGWFLKQRPAAVRFRARRCLRNSGGTWPFAC
jgi:hypothetical protein